MDISIKNPKCAQSVSETWCQMQSSFEQALIEFEI